MPKTLSPAKKHSTKTRPAPHGRHRAQPSSRSRRLGVAVRAQAKQVPETFRSKSTKSCKQPKLMRGTTPVVAALAATIFAVTGGGIAYATAHKTVSIDVDGETRVIDTFDRSVADVLAAEGVAVGAQDEVTPALAAKLTEGEQIVVRYAADLTYLAADHEESTTLAVLDAVDALAQLAKQQDEVALVASRDYAGRTDLGVRLSSRAPVVVVADGHHDVLPRGSQTIDGALSLAGVRLGAEDTVKVVPAAQIPEVADLGADVAVVVTRVSTTTETTQEEIPFGEVEQASSRLYKGESEVIQEGVAGQRVVVVEIVTVDGVETSRTTVSDEVVAEPVDEITAIGTKAKPTAAAQGSAPAGVWAALAQCESGGNPSAVSANGMYYGLYQFSIATWQSVGGSGLPSEASVAEQTQRAQILQARSGWGQWPACSAKIGVR